MPIPTTIADLNVSAALNSPAGSDSPTQGDDYIRALSSIIAQEHADLADATNAAKGAGQVGVNSRLAYAGDSVGGAVVDIGRSVRAGQATGDGSTDDTTAINACLALGGHWVIPAGYTFKISGTLLMGVAGTTLEVNGTLSFQSATTKGINVTAANCTITGNGKLLSPATFDGTNARRTYAVVWVAADGFTGSGRVWLDNIPRAGVHFEDCIGWVVSGWRLDGNFPVATYTGSGSTLTGHAGFSYNPPPVATTAESRGRLLGNTISTCVQGFLSGNFDDTASEAGVIVVGNTFHRCHDHGIYGALLESQVLTGNLFLNCKAPWVVDGRGCVVSGNTSFSVDSALSQVCSVRDATDAVVSGNTIVGASAAIDIACISGTTMQRVKVTDNTVASTGSGLAQFGIRVGFGAQVCEHIEVTGNMVSGGDFDALVGAIQFEMASGYSAFGNKLSNNTVIRTNVGPGIQAFRQVGMEAHENTIVETGSAGSATTVSMFYGQDITDSTIDGLRLHYRSGGTNVTARGVQLDTTGSAITSTKLARVDGYLTSGSLAGSDVLGFAVGNCYTRECRPSSTASMKGQATITSGSSSVAVSNANVLSNSHVSVEPNDLGAGQLIKDKGYRVDWTAGTLNIRTGDGSNAAADATFNYMIW